MPLRQNATIADWKDEEGARRAAQMPLKAFYAKKMESAESRRWLAEIVASACPDWEHWKTANGILSDIVMFSGASRERIIGLLGDVIHASEGTEEAAALTPQERIAGALRRELSASGDLSVRGIASRVWGTMTQVCQPEWKEAPDFWLQGREYVRANEGLAMLGRLLAEHTTLTSEEAETCVWAWYASAYRTGASYSIEQSPYDEKPDPYMRKHLMRHLSRAAATERLVPGGIATLVRTYRVRAFGRYLPETLAAQCEAADERGKQFVVIAQPLGDDNGVFARTDSLFERLRRDLAEKNHLLRIVEAGGGADLMERLDGLTEQHGDTRGKNGGTFAASVITGHGRENRPAEHVSLGRPHCAEGVFAAGDAEGACMRRNHRNGASSILITCSAGGEGGVAQQFSQALPDMTFYASAKPSNIASITVQDARNGGVELVAEFMEATRRFRGGMDVT